MTGWKSRFRRRLPDRRLVLHWLLGLLVAIFLTLVAGDRMRRGLFDSWQAANPRNLSATDVRVVLSSGFTEQDAVGRVFGAPAQGFIQKPWKPEALVHAIEMALAQPVLRT